jgi:hypothetical protein
MNGAKDSIWTILTGGDGDDRWRLVPTIVIVVLIVALWHWLHWYAAILIAVGVGIIVQAVMVAVTKRGKDAPPESESQQ